MDILRLIDAELSEIQLARAEGKYAEVYLSGAEDWMVSLRAEVVMGLAERQVMTEEEVAARNGSDCSTGNCEG